RWSAASDLCRPAVLDDLARAGGERARASVLAQPAGLEERRARGVVGERPGRDGVGAVGAEPVDRGGEQARPVARALRLREHLEGEHLAGGDGGEADDVGPFQGDEDGEAGSGRRADRVGPALPHRRDVEGVDDTLAEHAGGAPGGDLDVGHRGLVARDGRPDGHVGGLTEQCHPATLPRPPGRSQSRRHGLLSRPARAVPRQPQPSARSPAAVAAARKTTTMNGARSARARAATARAGTRASTTRARPSAKPWTTTSETSSATVTSVVTRETRSEASHERGTRWPASLSAKQASDATSTVVQRAAAVIG